MSPRPFRFLDLPPEIREKIYIHISTSPSPYILLNSSTAHSNFPLNLLLTNVQIYHELRPLYLTSNTFSMTIYRNNDAWLYFLSPSWQDNRRQIRSLRLNIIRWGTKNFFLESLVPILEDCILNGRLRDLEVRIREGWMKIMLAGKGNANWMANWKALRNLLRDPYLERAVLVAGQVLEDEIYDEPKRLEHSEPFLPFRHVAWVFDGDAWRKVSEEEQKQRRLTISPFTA